MPKFKPSISLCCPVSSNMKKKKNKFCNDRARQSVWWSLYNPANSQTNNLHVIPVVEVMTRLGCALGSIKSKLKQKNPQTKKKSLGKWQGKMMPRSNMQLQPIGSIRSFNSFAASVGIHCAFANATFLGKSFVRQWRV